MAKIPLRAYNSEIEKLIEAGQIPEAVAHSKHILKFFPKHIDTYRLLGKAFLESQRYSEAADILKRVLSVIPDDFISQIGMSIIREDEGNFDAAIFHMERAFEVQPANPAIQDELRRLFGRRDGSEPPKIRLTRGALVRMYTRGELFQQAIAEVRAALAEDPQRPDLQVLLARLYYLSGQKVQAAEVCSKLVSKLPYCYEANRILADVLPGTSRSDDAKIYQERIQALDPYIAFLQPGFTNSAEVPDAAVQIERLEYNAAAETTDQPEWTRTVGVAWDEADKAEVPDWLSGETGTKELPAATDGLAEQQALEPETAPAEIPDWMSAAGWNMAAEGDGAEEETAHADEETEAAPADVPDWLKSLAPDTLSDEISESSAADEHWADEVMGEAVQAQPVETLPELPVEAETGESSAALEAEMPDWLQQEESQPAAAVETGADDLPDWLKGPAEADAQPASEEELPDWLQAKADETTLPAAEEALPDWLSALQDQTPGDAVVEAQAEGLAETLPTDESLQPEEVIEPVIDVEELPAVSTLEIEPAEAAVEEESAVSAINPEENLDAAMAWLEALAAKQGADEGTLLIQPEQRSEEMPDWLKQEQAAASAEASVEPSTPEAEAVELGEEQGLLEVVQPAAEITEEPVVETADELVEGDLPDWLRGLEQEAIAQEPGITPVSEEIETPGAAAEIVEFAAEPQPKAEAVSEEPLAPVASDDIDSALAWLESLAAKQGAEEETLLVNPSDRVETPPEWVSKEQEIAAADVAAAESGELVEAVPAAEGAKVDAIEEESQPATAGEPVEVPAQEAAESDTGEPQAPIHVEWIPETEITPTDTAEVESAEELPEWLKDLDAYQSVPGITAEAQPAAQDLPDWLREIEDAPEAEAEPAVEEVTPTAGYDWKAETAELASDQPPAAEPVSDEPADMEEVAPEPVAEVQPEVVPQAAIEVRAQGSLLAAGKTALDHGDVDQALDSYNQLIAKGETLEDVIHDLRDALYRYPVNIAIWQSLGDAYLRSNHLQDALDAYTKAEELLR